MFTWILSGVYLCAMGTLFMAGTAKYREDKRTAKIKKRQTLQNEFDKKWKHVPLFDKFMFYIIVFNIIVLILIWIGRLIYPIFIA